MTKVLIILFIIILFHIICGTVCICYFIGNGTKWLTLVEVLLFMLFGPFIIIMYWISIIYYWIRDKFKKKNAV